MPWLVRHVTSCVCSRGAYAALRSQHAPNTAKGAPPLARAPVNVFFAPFLARARKGVARQRRAKALAPETHLTPPYLKTPIPRQRHDNAPPPHPGLRPNPAPHALPPLL